MNERFGHLVEWLIPVPVVRLSADSLNCYKILQFAMRCTPWTSDICARSGCQLEVINRR